MLGTKLITRARGAEPTSAIATIAAAGLLLAACPVPVSYAPYYRPAGISSGPIDHQSEASQVRAGQDELMHENAVSMIFAGCAMNLRGVPHHEGFRLYWDPPGPGRTCRLDRPGLSLVLEDLDTGRKRTFTIHTREFAGFSAPELEIDQTVDLATQIPGFAAVPPLQRRYTLAINLSRDFRGPLPDEFWIQLPAMSVGGHVVRPPPLPLRKFKKRGGDWWYTAAPTTRAVGARPAGPALGGGALEFKPADVWYEDGSVRLSAVFRGWKHAYDQTGMKELKGVSHVFGDVYVEVKRGQPIRLHPGPIAWREARDTAPVGVPATRWQLKEYTSVRLHEDLEGFLASTWARRQLASLRKTYENNALSQFYVALPGRMPKRVRVTLPSVLVGDRRWTVRPIVLEYKGGGTGVGWWP